ncbi:MAG: SDR family NAD(P)-dependent oxidoreductase [Chthonomonadales bacterium]
MNSPWKQAIVVGASSGIGEEIARQLSAAGVRVCLVARREDELKRIVSEMNNLGVIPSATSNASIGNAIYRAHDVTDIDSAPAIFQDICTELGGLDAIFYASGIMPSFALGEYDIHKEKAIIEINVIGAMSWINLAAERFGRTGAGTIVGISSVAGDRGRGGMAGYATSKAGLNTYMEAIRNRVGANGVNVVIVKPGPVRTPMTATSDVGKLPMIINADEAARLIISAAANKKKIAYVPRKWQLVMFIIRTIPSFLFQRMKNLNS